MTWIRRTFKTWKLTRLDYLYHNLKKLMLVDLNIWHEGHLSMMKDLMRLNRKQADLLAAADRLTALQAVDIGFKGRGKIIIIAKIAGRDIVKIIDVQRDLAMNEYIAMTKEFAARWGAKVGFVDSPGPTDIRLWRYNDDY